VHVAQHLPAEGFDSPLGVGSTARSCAAMAALTCLLRLARHAGPAPRKSDSPATTDGDGPAAKEPPFAQSCCPSKHTES
jgi:hypothetical protein